MQVSKWGNSLAIRLPAEVVGALGLKEGDHIEVGVDLGRGRKRKFTIHRDPKVEKALAQIRKLRRPLPAGFKFNRQGVHERVAQSPK